MGGKGEASTSQLPQTPQLVQNTLIAITPHDMQRMITEITAKLQTQLNTATPPTTVSNRAVKFPTQSVFSGKPDQLEPTIREAELRFSINEQEFNTPTKKAYYLLSLFTEGSAKLWKEQYILQRQDKSLCEADRWEEFKNTLRANFSDIGSKDDALQKLQNMRQGPKQNVDEFNTKFRILVQKAGIDALENNQILLAFYMQGIRQPLAQQILMQNPPPTNWGEAMRQAAVLDSHARRAHSFFAQAIRITNDSKKKGGWKSRHYASKKKTGEHRWKSTD
jgi:hypothetical protein